ncbi:MAG: KH domain-containing protein [bacterium]|nr:KH domain-containing protein [bacterium]
MTTQTFLTQLCEHCGLASADIGYAEEQVVNTKQITITVPEEDSGLFIGFHGETLDSLQRLTRIIFQESAEEKIVLNVNDYREQREVRLREMTAEAVERVLSGDAVYTFHSYLPAYERFIIHTALGEMPEAAELESISVGDGKDRRLQIQRKQA